MFPAYSLYSAVHSKYSNRSLDSNQFVFMTTLLFKSKTSVKRNPCKCLTVGSGACTQRFHEQSP